MGRQRNANVPEDGYISKQQFNNTGSIAKSDFAVVADLDNTRKIVFDPSAQATGGVLTIAAGASSGAITLTLPTSSGTISTTASSFANPMTTGGDTIYGGASGVATRLANGTNGQVLTSSGTTAAPTWTTVSAGANTTLSNLGTTAINASLVFDTESVYNVGSTAKRVLGVYTNQIIGGNNGARVMFDVDNAMLRSPSGGDAVDMSNHILIGNGSNALNWASGVDVLFYQTMIGRASTTAAGTGPIHLQTGVLMTTPEPGNFEYNGNSLFFTDAGSIRNRVNIGDQARVSSQFDKTNSTLANVTGLTANVVASGVYKFKAVLFVNPDAVGGEKYAIAGTATATSIVYQVNTLVNATSAYSLSSRQTSLGGSASPTPTATATYTEITGTIVVNAAGTLTVQFAQNTASGTSSVLVNSTFEVSRIS